MIKINIEPFECSFYKIEKRGIEILYLILQRIPFAEEIIGEVKQIKRKDYMNIITLLY